MAVGVLVLRSMEPAHSENWFNLFHNGCPAKRAFPYEFITINMELTQKSDLAPLQPFMEGKLILPLKVPMVKVLIIDDEVDICKLVAGYLGKRGYEVKFAHNLKRGGELLQEFTPEIIFLDLNLPDGTGLSLVPDIRKNLPDACIIVISAYDNFKDEKRLKKEIVDYFIAKPFNLELVTEAIRSCKADAEARKCKGLEADETLCATE